MSQSKGQHSNAVLDLFPMSLAGPGAYASNPRKRQAPASRRTTPPINEALNPSLLISILSRVSSASGSFSHALVCKHWLKLSYSAQSRVRIRPAASLSESKVVDLVNSFDSLKVLELPEASVLTLSDALFQRIAPKLTALRSLKIDRSAFLEAHPLDGIGLSSLFCHATNLTSCDLSFSHLLRFSFGLPETVSCLTWLTSLTCRTIHSLPSSISLLTSLRRLHLCSDSFGLPPQQIFSLTGLTHLALQFSQVTVLPEGIGILSNLLELEISSDRLRQLPPELLRLTRLRRLHLKCDSLQELPEDIHRLGALRSLEIPACTNLTGLPASLLRLRNFSHLNTGNVLHTLPGGLAGLTRLRNLCVSFLEDGDIFPSGMDALASTLRSLTFECCGLFTELPSDITALKGLRELKVDCCIELRKLPEDLCNLKDLKKLKLRSLPKVTTVPASLGTMTSLEVLILQSLDSVATLPESLSGLTNLKELSLGFCPRLSLPEALLQREIWKKAYDAREGFGSSLS